MTTSGPACVETLEEGRHALGLKKLAVKLGGAEFDSYAPEALLRLYISQSE